MKFRTAIAYAKHAAKKGEKIELSMIEGKDAVMVAVIALPKGAIVYPDDVRAVVKAKPGAELI